MPPKRGRKPGSTNGAKKAKLGETNKAETDKGSSGISGEVNSMRRKKIEDQQQQEQTEEQIDENETEINKTINEQKKLHNKVESAIDKSGRDKDTISKLLDQLNSTKNPLFESYKAALEQQNGIKTSLHDLISTSVSSDEIVHSLEQEIVDLKKQLAQSKKESKSISQYKKALTKYESVTDILESICGIRIEELDDTDNDNLVIQCVQGGAKGEINYELVLSSVSGEESIGDFAEVTYSPKFDESQEKSLKEIIPDYFFESLTFPVETLPQFYQKLWRALNK